ncbi:hypothetical protein XENORESO_016651 [Xenotaenia resolanae]|uniref:Secreted protein n=1 Tax=Xenotaenia resolanae TaxID=208358 RepID=A0ABV0WFG6_9TELE
MTSSCVMLKLSNQETSVSVYVSLLLCAQVLSRLSYFPAAAVHARPCTLLSLVRVAQVCAQRWSSCRAGSSQYAAVRFSPESIQCPSEIRSRARVPDSSCTYAEWNCLSHRSGASRSTSPVSEQHQQATRYTVTHMRHVHAPD